MSNVVSPSREKSIGSRVRKMRMRLHLTQRELAWAAGVSEKDIELLERDVPVILDCKRRVLKTLWGKLASPEHA